MATALKCSDTKTGTIIFYDYATNFIFQKDAPNSPVAALLTDKYHCNDRDSGPVAVRKSSSDNEQRTEYEAHSDIKGSNPPITIETLAWFRALPHNEAWFQCNNPRIRPRHFSLHSCHIVNTIE
jgi:hypothetical protein